MRITRLSVIFISLGSLIPLLFTPLAQSMTVYKGKDDKGNVIFSDRPLSTAQNEQIITINDTAPPSQFHQIKEAKNTFTANDTDDLIEKREQLAAQIKEAYASLAVSEEAFHSAQKRQVEQLKECEEKQMKFCHPESIATLEVEVVRTKSLIRQLEEQFNQLPK